MLGWPIGNWIVCDGSILGWPGLGGNCCVGWQYRGGGAWGGNLTFIIGTPRPTGWKCWEATGMNCCDCGDGAAGRNWDKDVYLINKNIICRL